MTSYARLHRGARANLFWTALGFLPMYVIAVVLLMLGLGVYALINRDSVLPRHELVVGLKKVDVSIFRVLEQGSAASFSEQDLKVMGDQPGVTSLHSICYGSLPAESTIAFFGREFHTEMVIQAFDRDWLPEFQTELAGWTPEKLVPIVVNSSILAIYNHAYSKSNNLPELSEAALKSPILTLTYGAEGKRVTIKGRVVGLSPKVALGAAVPLEVLAHMHKELGIAPPAVSEVVLRFEAGEDVERARDAVQKLGFVINEPGQFLQFVGIARRAAIQTFWPLFLFVCAMSLLFLFQGFSTIMQLQRSVYSQFLAEGVPRFQLCKMILLECVMLSLIFLSLGSGMGKYIADQITEAYVNPLMGRLLTETTILALPNQPLILLNLAMLLALLLLLLPRAFFATRQIPAAEL